MGRRKIFQSFNNKIDAWVKMKEMKDGRMKMMDVKQKDPTRRFKGVPIRKKSK